MSINPFLDKHLSQRGLDAPRATVSPERVKDVFARAQKEGVIVPSQTKRLVKLPTMALETIIAKDEASPARVLMDKLVARLREATASPAANISASVAVPDWQTFGQLTKAFSGVRIASVEDFAVAHLAQVTTPAELAGDHRLESANILRFSVKNGGTSWDELYRSVGTSVSQPVLATDEHGTQALVVPVADRSVISFVGREQNGELQPAEVTFALYRPEHNFPETIK